jgi:hypothetical protein
LQSIIPAPVAVLNLFTSAAVAMLYFDYIYCKEIPTINTKSNFNKLSNFIEYFLEFGILS